jgi:Nuclease-related domain
LGRTIVPTGVRPELAGRGGAAVRRTAAALAELEDNGWLVLHGLQRPGRRFASIDHIAVGPGGVAVIDTKDWAGTVDVIAGVLQQNDTSRERECDLAGSSAASVTAWLEPGQRTAVLSIICLVNQPTPAAQPSATAVYGVEDLAASLRALPHRLRTGEVWAVAELLRRTLADGPIPVQLTTASLATSIAEDSSGARASRPGLRERVRGSTRLRRVFNGVVGHER